MSEKANRCLRLGLLSAALLNVSLYAFAGNNDVDCRHMTVTQIKKALETKKFTSEQCVRSILTRINEVSPVNPPQVVPYTYTCGPTCGPADNLAAYNDLNTEFIGLNTFAGLNSNAISQAQQADALRKQGVKNKPLLGIPIAIKDNVATVGIGPNASGDFGQIGYVPPQNARIVQSLLDAGAIIIGKNNLSDIAFSSSGINFAFGPVRNAYDMTRDSGASTAGGSVAIAARLVPAVVGNDLGGSLRVPASFNGIIGYRPTYGRYTTPNPDIIGDTIVDPRNTMGTNGLEARSIADIVLMDQVITAPNGVQVKLNQKLKGLRLGVPDEYYQNLDPEEKAVIEKALSRLEDEGAVLIHTPNIPGLDPGITLPIGPIGNLQTLYDLWFARIVELIGAPQDPTIPPPTLDSPNVAAGLVGQLIPIYFGTFPDDASALAYNDYLLSLTATSLSNYKKYFLSHRVEAVIYPTVRVLPKSIEELVVNGGNPFTNGLFDFATTLPDGSVTGVTVDAYTQNAVLSPVLSTPSLNVPIGLTDNSHLPVGMQIEGLPNGDSRLLEIGSAFEKVFKINPPAIAGGDDCQD